MSLIARCWKPFGLGDDANAGKECKDGLLWFRDIGRFAAGDFSMAVVQANQVLEDQSQIESGPFGTFVGVYDGHGGPDCSRYVCDNLFRNLQGYRFNPSFPPSLSLSHTHTQTLFLYIASLQFTIVSLNCF